MTNMCGLCPGVSGISKRLNHVDIGYVGVDSAFDVHWQRGYAVGVLGESRVGSQRGFAMSVLRKSRVGGLDGRCGVIDCLDLAFVLDVVEGLGSNGRPEQS